MVAQIKSFSYRHWRLEAVLIALLVVTLIYLGATRISQTEITVPSVSAPPVAVNPPAPAVGAEVDQAAALRVARAANETYLARLRDLNTSGDPALDAGWLTPPQPQPNQMNGPY